MKSWLQVSLIFGNLKWIIITSILISGLVFITSQVRELYRVSADEDGLGPLTVEYVSIVVTGIVIWFGAIALIEATLNVESKQFGRLADRTVRYLPLALACLPILAAGLAQFLSEPELKTVPLHVGSVILIQAMSLRSVTHHLGVFGWAMILTAILMAIFLSMLSRPIVQFAKTINAAYFSRHRSTVATIIAIIFITALFILFPVSLPQRLTTFGVLALFTLCVTAMCLHLSLVTIRYRVPVIPIVLLYALGISAFDLNDNHAIRILKTSAFLRGSRLIDLLSGKAILRHG